MSTSTLLAAVSGSIGGVSFTAGQPTVWDLFGQIIDIIDTIIVPLLFAIAFLVFLFGIYQYFIAGAADEEKRKTGREFVMYGLIGFFLMVSVWGLVNVLVASLGFGSQTRPDLPCFGDTCNGSGFNINIKF